MARLEGILILGAGGFLGPRLVRAALARDAEPVLAASRHPGAALAAEDARRARLFPLDLAAEGGLERLLAAERPRAVVLAAALARAADVAARPERAWLLNAGLPARVAGSCARLGARLVHVSTDLVFGGEDAPAGGLDEDARPAPLSAYGRGKAEGERGALAAGALVVRLPLLVGSSAAPDAGGPGGRGLGASDAVLAAVARGERPPLFVDEWRTPLHVDDAARALVECAGLERAGMLHVAGPERLSRHELGLVALEAAGLDAERARAAVRPARRAELGLERERARDVSLDASRARALLATPLRSVREALRGDRTAAHGAPPPFLDPGERPG